MIPYTKEDISAASKEFGLPQAYIKILVKKGVISFPLSYPDRIILKAFSKTWSDIGLLKIGLSKHSKAARLRAVSTVGMTRLESHIFTRLCEARKEGRIVYTDALILEIQHFYGPLNAKRKQEIRKIIEKMRKKVSNSGECRKNKSLQNYTEHKEQNEHNAP